MQGKGDDSSGQSKKQEREVAILERVLPVMMTGMAGGLDRAAGQRGHQGYLLGVPPSPALLQQPAEGDAELRATSRLYFGLLRRDTCCHLHGNVKKAAENF